MIPKGLKPIPGFPGYFARIDGTIWSVRRQTRFNRKDPVPYQLTKGIGVFGHRLIGLMHDDGRRTTERVAVLMLETFGGHRPRGMWALHGPSGCTIDSIDNLYWGTPVQNSHDKLRDGTALLGDKNHKTKLNELQVRIIRRVYELGGHPKEGGQKRILGRITHAYLAKIFGIDKKSIVSIIKLRNWAHVPFTPSPRT